MKKKKVKLTLPAEIVNLPQEQKADILKSIADQIGINTTTSHNHERDMWTPDEVPMIASLEDWFYGSLLARLQTFYMDVAEATGLQQNTVTAITKGFGDEFFDWIEKSDEGRKNFNLSDMIKMDRERRKKIIQYVQDGGVYAKEQWSKFTQFIDLHTPKFADLLESYALRSVLMGKIKNVADINKLEMVGTLIEHMPFKLEQVREQVPPITLTNKEGEKHVVQMYPLTAADLKAVQYAEQHSAIHVTHATERLKAGIRETIANGRLQRKPIWQVQQDLLYSFGKCNRDFRKIALTEITDAMANGYLASLKPGTRIIGMGAANACPYCKKLIIGKEYTFVEEPGDPETTVWIGKTNVGRKAKEYIPTIPLHPHCRCRWTRLGDFQGVDKETGAIFIRPLDELIEEYKKKDLIHRDYDRNTGGPKGDYSKWEG